MAGMVPASTGRWSAGDLDNLTTTREIEISVPRSDGTRGRWTPIWVVVVGDQAFVRTWYRRDTGWYGRAVATGRGRICLAGDEVEVTLSPAGDETGGVVSTAYETKYGKTGATSMTTPESVASTLRIAPTGTHRDPRS